LNKSEENPKLEEIISIASRLFSQRGYGGTTLRAIGNRAGLHKSSLFHYFKNKEEILMAVMDKSLKDHMNILNDIVNDPHLSGMEKLKAALEKQVAEICKYTDHINVYLSEIKSLTPKNRRKYKLKRKRYENYFEKIIKEVQADKKSKLFRGLDPKIVNLGILGMCNWMIVWYEEKGPLTPEDIYQIFYAMITNTSLQKSKPKKRKTAQRAF